jgi:8-oxo-dGTP pyrophosphatase MutT (NUDIX family)
MSEHNPWTTLSSRLIYDNEWMRVREDAVRRPDGSDGIYGVMEAKKVATGVVALTDADEVVLVGQWRYPTKGYSWEIVEGGADPGEEPLAAAKRELREEAGLEAERWEPLGGELHLSNCITDEVGYLYLARGLSEVGADPDPTEVLTLDRVPLAEAVRRVESGEITDAMSVMGLLLAARL